jgi:hypothetical protein
MYVIRHGFICRSADSTASEDAGIEPKTAATSALEVRHSNHLAIDLLKLIRKFVNADVNSQKSSRYYYSFFKFFCENHLNIYVFK